MTESEPARLALYNRLEEVLGGESAETLMSSLPEQPASRLATKSDLDRLDARFDGLDRRIDKLETRVDKLEDKVDTLASEMRAGFGEVHTALREQQRTYTMVTIGSLTALTAIFSVIVGLIT